MPKPALPIDVEEMRKLFKYDALTGKLYWRNKSRKHHAGAEAGSVGSNQYMSVVIGTRAILVHRICYLLGDSRRSLGPQDLVDHRDGNKTNNAKYNLRKSTASKNQMNKGASNRTTTGIKNLSVYNQRRKTYVASFKITRDGRKTSTSKSFPHTPAGKALAIEYIRTMRWKLHGTHAYMADLK